MGYVYEIPSENADSHYEIKHKWGVYKVPLPITSPKIGIYLPSKGIISFEYNPKASKKRINVNTLRFENRPEIIAEAEKYTRIKDNIVGKVKLPKDELSAIVLTGQELNIPVQYPYIAELKFRRSTQHLLELVEDYFLAKH